MKRIPVVLFALTLLLGCESSEGPSCDICTSSAILRGHVRTSAGSPVVDAPVEFSITSTEYCKPEFGTGFGARVSTDQNGEYRLVVRIGVSPGLRCVFGRVEDDPDNVESGVVVFRADWKPGDPLRELLMDFEVNDIAGQEPAR